MDPVLVKALAAAEGQVPLVEALGDVEDYLLNLSGELRLQKASVARQLIPLISSNLRHNNHKVVLATTQLLSVLVDKLGRNVESVYVEFVHGLASNLGHIKVPVRQITMECLLKFMSSLAPYVVWDELIPLLPTTRSSHTRTCLLVLFVQCLKIFGAPALPFVAFLDEVIPCLADTDAAVRQNAMNCLTLMYTYCGDELVAAVREAVPDVINMHYFDNFLDIVSDMALMPQEDRVGIKEPYTTAAIIHEPKIEKKKKTDLSASQKLSAVTAHTKTELLRKKRLNSKTIAAAADDKELPSTESNCDEHDGYVTNDNLSLLNLDAKMKREVVLVHVNTDRELDHEFNKIQKALRNTQHEFWKKRVSAIYRLEGLLMGQAYERSNFLSNLQNIREVLILQVLDLRSTVVRAACRLLCLLSKVLGADFSPFADAVIPMLLKLVSLNVAVMVRSGDICIRIIMQNTPLNKAIGALLQAATSTQVHAQVRVKAVDYLRYVLIVDTRSDSALFRHHYPTMLRNQISKGLLDKSAEVRHASRQCYWAFHARFPTKGNEIYNELDLRTQRLLNDEKENYQMNTPASANIASIPNASSSSSSGNSRSKKSSTSSMKMKTRKTMTMTANESKETKSSLIRRNRTTSLDTGRNSTSSSSLKTGPQRVAPQVNQNLPKEEQPKKRLSALSGGAQRAVPKQPISSGRNSEYGGATTNRRRDDNHDEQTTIKTTTGISERQRIAKLITTKGKSTQWTERLACVRELARLFAEPMDADYKKRTSQHTPLSRNLSKIIVFTFERLLDGHHKVLNETLNMVSAMFASEQLAIESLNPYLERLIPFFFTLLTSSHASIREASNNILSDLPSYFAADTLMVVLLRVLDHANVKVVLGTLEYLRYMLPSCTELFLPPKTSSLFKQVVLRMEPLLVHSDSMIMNVAADIVVFLYELEPDESPAALANCVASLPLDAQRRLRDSLSSRIPEFQEIVVVQKKTAWSARREEQDLNEEGTYSKLHSNRRQSGGGYAHMYGYENQQDERKNTAEHEEGNSTSLVEADVQYADVNDDDEDEQNDQQQQQQRVADEDEDEYDQTIDAFDDLDDASSVGPDYDSDDGEDDRYSPELYQDDEEEEEEELDTKYAQPISPVRQQAQEGKLSSQAVSEARILLEQWQDVKAVDASLNDLLRLYDKNQRKDYGYVTCLAYNAIGEQLFNNLFQRLVSMLDLTASSPGGMVSPMLLERISVVLQLFIAVFEDQADALSTYQPVTSLLSQSLMLFRLSETHYSSLHALTAQLLSVLTGIVDSSLLISTLGEVVTDKELQREGTMLKYSVRMLSAVIVTLSRTALRQHIDFLLSGLNVHISNPNAVIRMAVIGTFVAMHTVLGDELFDHLSTLNVVQIKLIKIYIRKAQK